jgi:hypothetical protein
MIADATGFKGTFKWNSSRPDGQPRRALDTSKAQKIFGFRAEMPLETFCGPAVCIDVREYGGKGHNVTALTLPGDEGYAILVSETRPGDVWTCNDLNGPYTYKGRLKGVQTSNCSIIVRPDGDYEIVPRNGQVYISKKEDGILGPYTSQGPSVFPRGIPNLEDPALFYAAGMYHITVNSWSTRKAYHLTSADGIHNWVNRGSAYTPTVDFVKYTDGTLNHWDKAERPGVYIENGHVAVMTAPDGNTFVLVGD